MSLVGNKIGGVYTDWNTQLQSKHDFFNSIEGFSGNNEYSLKIVVFDEEIGFNCFEQMLKDSVGGNHLNITTFLKEKGNFLLRTLISRTAIEKSCSNTNSDGTCRGAIEYQSYQKTIMGYHPNKLNYKDPIVKQEISNFINSQRENVKSDEGQRFLKNFVEYVEDYPKLAFMPNEDWGDHQELYGLGDELYHKNVWQPTSDGRRVEGSSLFQLAISTVLQQEASVKFTWDQMRRICHSDRDVHNWVLEGSHFFFGKSHKGQMIWEKVLEAIDNLALQLWHYAKREYGSKKDVINEIPLTQEEREADTDQDIFQFSTTPYYVTIDSKPLLILFTRIPVKTDLRLSTYAKKGSYSAFDLFYANMSVSAMDTLDQARLNRMWKHRNLKELTGELPWKLEVVREKRNKCLSGPCKELPLDVKSLTKTHSEYQPDWNVVNDIPKQNLIPGCEADMLLVDIDEENIGGLVGLGTPFSFIPFANINEVREAWISTLKRSNKDPTNSYEAKKVYLLPTVLFINEGTKSYRSNLRQKTKLIIDNNWGEFRISNYKGRSRSSSNKKDVTERQYQQNRDLLGTGMLEDDVEAETISQVKMHRHKRVRKLLKDNEIGRAFQVLNSNTTPAISGDDTYKFLQSMCNELEEHDKEKIDEILQEYIDIPVENRPSVSMDQVMIGNYVKAMPRGVRHGFNLSADILKAMCHERGGGHAEEFRKALSEFITIQYFNVVAPGSKLARFRNGSELLAIQCTPSKKRDLAMMDPFRKLAGLHFNSIVKEPFMEKFKYIQLGTGIRNGGSIVIHTTQTMWDIGGRALMATDVASAYPSTNKAVVLEEVAKVAPNALGMQLNALGSFRKSWYHGCDEGMRAIEIDNGLPTGASDSTNLFAISVIDHTIKLDTIMAKGGGFMNQYVDDTQGVSNIENSYEAMVLDLKGGRGVGKRNVSKNAVMFPVMGSEDIIMGWHSRFCELGMLPERVMINPEDYSIVTNLKQRADKFGKLIQGIPLGSEEFRNAQFLNMEEDMLRCFKNIEELNDPHLEFIFVSSIMKCKLVHWFRGVYPSEGMRLAVFYDRCLRKAICHIAMVDSITDVSFELARISIADGGAGLGFAEDIVDAAYVASLAGAWDAMKTRIPECEKLLQERDGRPKALEEFVQAIDRLKMLSPDITIQGVLADGPGSKKLQKNLGRDRVRARALGVEDRLRNSDPMGLANFLSGKSREAGAFLEAIPTSKAFQMDGERFACVFRNRLLIDHPNMPTKPICHCGRENIDNRGVHLQKCFGDNALSIRVHNDMVQEICACVRAAGLDAKSEQMIFREADIDDNGIADVVITESGGIRIAGDVRITNAVTSEAEMGHILSSGTAVRNAERQKIRLYAERAKAIGVEFVPWVFSSQGEWGPCFKKQTFERLINLQKRNNPFSTSNYVYWMRRLSVRLQMGIATEILTRMKFTWRGIDGEIAGGGHDLEMQIDSRGVGWIGSIT